MDGFARRNDATEKQALTSEDWSQLAFLCQRIAMENAMVAMARACGGLIQGSLKTVFSAARFEIYAKAASATPARTRKSRFARTKRRSEATCATRRSKLADPA